MNKLHSIQFKKKIYQAKQEIYTLKVELSFNNDLKTEYILSYHQINKKKHFPFKKYENVMSSPSLLTKSNKLGIDVQQISYQS